MSTAHIGARVAQARRERGLTQSQLAGAINFRPRSSAPSSPGRRPHCSGSVAAAIDAYDDPQLSGAVHPLIELESMFADTERWWRTGRYDRMSLVLPELLGHLYVHVRDAPPGTEHAERAHALLADTYWAVQAAAGRYGCTDVVGIAVERHLAAAAASGDPLRPVVAAFRRSQLQIRWGRFDSAAGSLQRAESSIAALSDPRAEAVRVQLQLRQAVVRARQGDRNTADELVTEARARTRARQLPAHPVRRADTGRARAVLGRKASTPLQQGWALLWNGCASTSTPYFRFQVRTSERISCIGSYSSFDVGFWCAANAQPAHS